MKAIVIFISSFISAANFWSLKTKNGKDAMNSWHFLVNMLCLVAIEIAWSVLGGGVDHAGDFRCSVWWRP